MAIVVRKTRVANPARRSGKSRRNLSPKQIKYFGSPAQKAALKRSRSAKRAAAKRAKPVSRPVARRTARKRNIGQIVSIGLGNPARKGNTTMAKTRKSKARPTQRSYKPKRRRARKNPFFGMAKKHRSRSTSRQTRRRPRRHVQHNPSARGIAGVFIKAAWVVGGLVGARGLTQAVYSATNSTASNTGVVGYLSNIVASFLLGGAVRKFIGKEQGNLVLIGGIAGVVARYVSENTSVGKVIQTQLSGLGDLGIYMPTTFFTPLVPTDSQTLTGGANMLLPQSVQDAINARAAALVAAGPSKGMGDVGSGVGSRYSTAGRYN